MSCFSSFTAISDFLPGMFNSYESYDDLLLTYIRDYFIASGVIYFLSLIASHIRTYLMHGIHNATLELLPSGLVRVAVPSIIKWTPGQHVFVRFLTSDLHLLTAHPFTISSACRNPDEIGKASELVFYIKPRGGVPDASEQWQPRIPAARRRS